MELQDVTADMGDAPQVGETQSESDSQADTGAEEVTPVESVEETSPQETTEETSEEGVESTEVTGATEEEVPFFEKPGVKERMEGIEDQYGSKASYWDTIAEISQNDPEFRQLMVRRLEDAGKIPKGTAETLQRESEQAQQQAQSESQYVDNLPQDVKDDLQAARQIRQEQEVARSKKEQDVENFFQGFEKDKPDIDKSPNPARTRSLIFNMASEMVDRGKGKVAFEDAMAEAYKVVLHPESIAEGAKEDGQVEALVQANQEAASGVTSGSKKTGKAVKLSQDEKRAADLIGITPEEYRKYKDSDDDDLFESI